MLEYNRINDKINMNGCYRALVGLLDTNPRRTVLRLKFRFDPKPRKSLIAFCN